MGRNNAKDRIAPSVSETPPARVRKTAAQKAAALIGRRGGRKFAATQTWEQHSERMKRVRRGIKTSKPEQAALAS